LFKNNYKLNNKLNTKYSFEVEFSIPKKIKPIPEGTVKVYFTVMDAEEGTAGTEGYDVEFNFENESLKHRIGNTMRSNMYEVRFYNLFFINYQLKSWINTVLEKKLKVKTELHLGSEFEHTRFVGEDGQMVDPFVPAFDIMKVKDLTSKKRESQKINVQSPRFTSALKRALE